MAETEQWARGRDVRRAARPEGRFVLGLLPPPPDAVLDKALAEHVLGDGSPLTGFRHALFMPAAHRSLHQIRESERPEPQVVSVAMRLWATAWSTATTEA